MSGKAKPTWVFIAGPYRSGSTTQYQITEDIIHETKSGKGIGYHTEAKLVEFDVEGNKPFVVCKVFEFLPDGFKGEKSYGRFIAQEDRMLSIVSIRDPRDIAVSMRTRALRRGDGFDFEQVATKDFPVWFSNVEKWIGFDASKSYWSKFEDFTTNLLAETRRIAEHLGIDLEDDHAKDIAARYTIRAQQKKKQDFKKAKPDAPSAREHPWLPSIPEVLFGTSGHFRTWLNGPERRMVEEANAAFMKRFGYLGDNDD